MHRMTNAVRILTRDRSLPIPKEAKIMRVRKQMFSVRSVLLQFAIAVGVALSLLLSSGLLAAQPSVNGGQGADGRQYLAGPSHDDGGG
jgi:hypothetical protein